MRPQAIIADFAGLVGAVLTKLSQNKLAERTGRDHATVARWEEGTFPKVPSDVAVIIQTAMAEGIDVGRFQTHNSIYDMSDQAKYEDKVRNGPPDLSWLTSARVPPPFQRTICGITVFSPIGIASSPLMADPAWTGLMLDLGFGLSTFKTRRADDRESWPAPQLAYVVEPPDLTHYDPSNPPAVVVAFRRPPTGGILDILNSIGVPSEKTPVWKQMITDIKRHERGYCVGASVMGEGKTEKELLDAFDRAVREVAETKAAFVEVNVSCPNLEKGGRIFADLKINEAISKQSAKILHSAGIPFFIKAPFLRPQHVEPFVRAVVRYVDGICLRNSIRVKPFTRDRDRGLIPAFPGREFGGLTGPCTFDLTRSGVRALMKTKADLKADFAVIAIGGVSSAREVVELLNEGVDTVQACTAPMFDPLLAWKARYHLDRADTLVLERGKTQSTVETLLFPIHESEFESYKHAEAAIRLVKKRSPGVDVSHERFTAIWNDWMKESPASPAGTSQRMRTVRSVVDWVRVFTR